MSTLSFLCPSTIVKCTHLNYSSRTSSSRKCEILTSLFFPKFDPNLKFISTQSLLKYKTTFPITKFRNNTIKAEIVQFSPDDFSVERLIATYGIMSVSTITPSSNGINSNIAAGYDLQELNRMAEMKMGQESVQVRVYKGKISTFGPRLGTRVLLKAYPSNSPEADAMAANELSTHFKLQEDDNISPNVSVLLGGFETNLGEKWLVLRDDGSITAADYAKLASEAMGRDGSIGEGEFFDFFDKSLPILRRQNYVRQLLRGVISGLSYVHSKGVLHQSIGPSSVVLNSIEERDTMFLFPQLRDFAFSVDVSEEAMLGGSFQKDEKKNIFLREQSEQLWRRADRSGAKLIFEKKNFGLADDIYALGLLIAYLCFVPFCEKDSIDLPTIQKLIETTFRLDLLAFKEYCSADDRWSNAVNFLNRSNNAGWDVLQMTLNVDYRIRPDAESLLKHPFFN